MIGISEKEQVLTQTHDFELGIVGFRYSDLYDAEKKRQPMRNF